MIKKLKDIASMTSGIYAKSDYEPDTLYLQAVHFDQFGVLDSRLKPQLKLGGKIDKHLLEAGDVLFAAKGTNNFGVVYHSDHGPAVASSSFIILKLAAEHRNLITSTYLAWYLTNTKEIKSFHRKQLGTTVPSISIKMLGEVEVNIPSLDKQHLIDKIQQLRNRQKRLTHQLEEARANQVQQLLINALNEK